MERLGVFLLVTHTLQGPFDETIYNLWYAVVAEYKMSVEY